MKKARIAELKNHLSRYLDHVKGGGSVLVLDRDQPVAQIVPLQSAGRGSGSDEERLARLERRGASSAVAPVAFRTGLDGVNHQGCAVACSRTS